MMISLRQGKKEQIVKIFVGMIFIIIGVCTRTFFNKGYAHPIWPIFGNNIEAVTVIGLLSGYLIGVKWGWVIPFSIMIISDRMIGNDAKIILFTWTGFIVPAVVGYLIKKISPKVSWKFLAGGVCGSVLSVLFFFVWTNFGVWLFWYSHTLRGLLECYTLAIPFLINQLKGNLVISGLVFGCILFLKLLLEHAKIAINRISKVC